VESTIAVLGQGVNARMDINEMTAKNKFSILSRISIAQEIRTIHLAVWFRTSDVHL